MGPFYAAGLYPRLAEHFRRHGYALAVHGSVANDFDLIACPWIETAADPQTVIDAIAPHFACDLVRYDDPSPRAHGRIAYNMALSFGDCRLDISFMPRLIPIAEP
jgi:hypothetical protein